MLEAILSGYSIGTPATRAETIKKLKDVGYIFTENKQLRCSDLGKKLVETFPVKNLFDLEFTGKLEKTLSDIEKRKFTKKDFLDTIFTFTTEAVQTIKQEEDNIIQEVTSKRRTREVLGKCPVCGNAIIEGQKGFGCSNWKSGCSFVIWKNDKYLSTMKKKPTKMMVKTLLKDGNVFVKGLKSKKGNTFDAYLSYEKNAENDYYSWKMAFKNK
jgi:DNA topoisomerase III